MKKQTRHDLAFWKRQLEQWRTSGLTQKAYCSRQNLSYTTFARYRNRIHRERKGETTAATAAFVPVMIRPEATAPAAAKPRCDDAEKAVEVRLGNGRAILLHGGFDDAQLGRLVRLLETLPC